MAPFGLSPFGLSPFGLSPFGLTPFGLAPFGLAPFDLALFGISRSLEFSAVRDSAPFGIWRRSGSPPLAVEV